MKAELRADGLHISGYVNVPGRESRPVMTPHGRVVEIIEQGAFGRAIKRAKKIVMLLDHNHSKILASTANGTLTVSEDAVGPKASSVVTDPEIIADARAGRLRGWSFDIKNPVDTVEERADKLPIRRITDFDISEITLVRDKYPVYSSMSLEVRADDGEDTTEYRACEDGLLEFTEQKQEPEKKPSVECHKPYRDVISRLRVPVRK